MQTKKLESANDFYNSIAWEYDQLLTAQDDTTRDAIGQIFQLNVSPGKVMDFGGGTGLDLDWLCDKYEVYFLEPSIGMREKAKKRHGHSDVLFIENGTDFRNWSDRDLPATDMKAVLANFAVLNCFRDITLFFEKISLVLVKDGKLIVTVLNPGFHSLLKNYSLPTALRSLFYHSISVQNQYKGKFHNTFIHSMSHLNKASSRYFETKSKTSIEGSDFITIVFERL